MRALALRLLVVGGLLCGLAPVAAGQGITYFPPAGGTVTSPVATDPLLFTGAAEFNNVANTPLVCSDGVTSPSLASAAGANLAMSATAPAATTGASQAGKTVTITASNAVASTDTASAAAGGSVTIQAGNAARLTSSNANGGDINLVTGAGIGTGVAGSVVVPAGAVSAPALRSSGDADTGLYFLDSGRSPAFAVNGVLWMQLDGVNSYIGVRGPLQVGTGVAANAPGAIYGAANVTTVATTATPSGAYSMRLHTNGADVDGQAVTLPDNPTAGTCYEFALTSTDTSGAFVIAPSAGETLQDAASTCATSFSATAKGATARICAVSGGSGALWLVMSKNGTWTCS